MTQGPGLHGTARCLASDHRTTRNPRPANPWTVTRRRAASCPTYTRPPIVPCREPPETRERRAAPLGQVAYFRDIPPKEVVVVLGAEIHEADPVAARRPPSMMSSQVARLEVIVRLLPRRIVFALGNLDDATGRAGDPTDEPA